MKLLACSRGRSCLDTVDVLKNADLSGIGREEIELLCGILTVPGEDYSDVLEECGPPKADFGNLGNAVNTAWTPEELREILKGNTPEITPERTLRTIRILESDASFHDTPGAVIGSVCDALDAFSPEMRENLQERLGVCPGDIPVRMMKEAECEIDAIETLSRLSGISDFKAEYYMRDGEELRDAGMDDALGFAGAAAAELAALGAEDGPVREDDREYLNIGQSVLSAVKLIEILSGAADRKAAAEGAERLAEVIYDKNADYTGVFSENGAVPCEEAFGNLRCHLLNHGCLMLGPDELVQALSGETPEAAPARVAGTIAAVGDDADASAWPDYAVMRVCDALKEHDCENGTDLCGQILRLTRVRDYTMVNKAVLGALRDGSEEEITEALEMTAPVDIRDEYLVADRRADGRPVFRSLRADDAAVFVSEAARLVSGMAD